MSTQLNIQIDCSDLSSNEINYQVKELIFNKAKYILLKNVHEENKLLEGLISEIKIEILGNVGSYFASDVQGLKIIVNGNVNDNSAWNVKEAKFTIFGSCENNFGAYAETSEFYIFENCGLNSFSNLNKSSKVVLGGLPGNGFANGFKEGVIVILNLQGGNIFIEDNWLVDQKGGVIYLRSSGGRDKIKTTSNRFLIEEVKESDEDICLPLISEFARLFNYSLDEIKSKPFYRINLK